MSVEKKIPAQLPVDEIRNITQSPRYVTRDVVEARVARLVYELNAGLDLVPERKGFSSIKAMDDWQKHVDNQPSMGD